MALRKRVPERSRPAPIDRMGRIWLGVGREQARMRAGDRGRARTCNLRVRSPMLYPVALRGPGSGQNHPRRSSCSELNPGLFKRAPDRPACATVIGGSSSTLSARANVSGRSLQARARSFRSEPSKVRAARICEPVITIPNPCPCLMGCDLLAWRRSPPSEVASCRLLQREAIAAPPRRSSSRNRSP